MHPGAFSLVNIFYMNLTIERADHPGVRELCVGLTLTVNADISCLWQNGRCFAEVLYKL